VYWTLTAISGGGGGGLGLEQEGAREEEAQGQAAVTGGLYRAVQRRSAESSSADLKGLRRREAEIRRVGTPRRSSGRGRRTIATSGLPVKLDGVGDGHPVAVGKHEVEEDEVELPGDAEPDGFVPRRCGGDLVTGGFRGGLSGTGGCRGCPRPRGRRAAP